MCSRKTGSKHWFIALIISLYFSVASIISVINSGLPCWIKKSRDEISISEDCLNYVK